MDLAYYQEQEEVYVKNKEMTSPSPQQTYLHLYASKILHHKLRYLTSQLISECCMRPEGYLETVIWSKFS